MIKYYKIVSYSSGILWIVLGIQTIASIVLGSIGMFVNIVMGIVFCLIGIYIYIKSKTTTSLFGKVKSLTSNNKNLSLQKNLNKFLSLEMTFAILSLLFVLLLISAAISRFYIEGLPIFG